MSPGSLSPGVRELLERNRLWVWERLQEDPLFFARLAEGQQPAFLFIGCSDSRKSLNPMTGTQPGELFIHRNIANQVSPDDLNVQAVMEFAFLHLKVRHVIVAGHTRCGGVKAAWEGLSEGAVGAWLGPLRELAARHQEELEAIEGARERLDRLSEINVVGQVENVLRSPAYREALRRGMAPEVHGWMLPLETGLIQQVELPRQAWEAAGLLGRYS